MTQDKVHSTVQWPSRAKRLDVQQKLNTALAAALDAVQTGSVSPTFEPATLRERLQQYDFKQSIGMLEASEQVLDLLKPGMVHMMHPAHFGLFNPSVVFPGILADQIAAHLARRERTLESRATTGSSVSDPSPPKQQR